MSPPTLQDGMVVMPRDEFEQMIAGLKAACDDLEQLLESIGYHSGDSSDGSYDADYTEN